MKHTNFGKIFEAGSKVARGVFLGFLFCGNIK